MTRIFKQSNTQEWCGHIGGLLFISQQGFLPTFQEHLGRDGHRCTKSVSAKCKRDVDRYRESPPQSQILRNLNRFSEEAFAHSRSFSPLEKGKILKDAQRHAIQTLT
jgi:hypothetical protein